MSKLLKTPDNSREQGQTLILVGVMLLVLLGLAAMAVDVGEVLWSRGAEQNAADAAALAGVKALPGDAAAAVSIANSYAASNGFSSATPGVQVTAIPTKVTLPSGTAIPALDVTVQRSVPPGLRAAVGGGDITVPARAIAVVTSAMPPCKYFPLAIQENILPIGFASPVPYQWLIGYYVRIKVGSQDNYTPGNFGAIDVTGTGGANYRDNLASGGACVNPPPVPGTLISSLPGNKIGPTGQGILDLLEAVNGNKSTWPSICAVPGTVCTNGVPDNVFWRTSSLLGSPIPAPPPTPAPPDPWGLGSPLGSSIGCSGVPTNTDTTDPDVYSTYPKVAWTCPRVVFLPIIDLWDNGNKDVRISGWAAFYVIGTEDSGGDTFLTGSFLGKVVVTDATPIWGDPNGSAIVAYLLWR